MAILKVYNGASWDVALGKTYNGSAWEDQMNFYDGTAFVELYPSGPTVSPNTMIVSKVLTSAGTCYARISINLSGVEWHNTSAGSPSQTFNRGNWLDSGASSEVWIQRVITSGTLTVDAGSGRLQLSSTRTFDVQRSASGFKRCDLTFNYYDAASGGNLIGSASLYLKANKDT